MNNYQKNILTAAKGGSIGFSGTVFSYAIGFIFTYILARYLGAEDFGYYKLSLTFVIILSAISNFGLSAGIKRFIPIAQGNKNQREIWGVIQIGAGIPFLASILITVLTIIFADTIALGMFDKPQLAQYLRLMSVAIPLSAIMSSMAEISIAFKNMRYPVITREGVVNVVKLSLAIVAILLGLGLVGVIVAYVIASIVGTLLMIYFVNKIFPLKRPISEAQRKTREILNFSIPVWLSKLLNQFSKNLETLVLGMFGIISEVGVYSVLINISNIGKMGFIAIRTISYPIFAELHSQGKLKELKDFYKTTAKWAFTINLPIFLTITIFAENILFIFGEEFTTGKLGLVILASSIIYDAATGACGAVLNMAGYSRINFINSIVYLITTLALDFILIPKYGLVGAALAGAITIVIVNTLMMVEAYILIDRLVPVDRSFLKPVIATLVAGAAAFYLRDIVLVDSLIIQLIVLTVIMWAIFLGMIIVQKFSEEDKLVIGKVLAKFKKNNK